MFKSVLVLVVLGLAGPQCPSSDERAAVGPTALDVPPAVDVAAESGPASEDASAAEVGAADGAPVHAQATEAAVDTPVDRLRRAREAFEAERWSEAEDGFRALLGTWPAVDDVLHYWTMAAARRGGRIDEARAEAELVVAAGLRRTDEAGVELADVAFQQQRWSEAATAYEALLRRRLPREIDEAALRFRLARCREELGDVRKVRRDYERLVRQEPDHAAASDAEARLRALDPAFTLPPAWRLERARVLVRRREWARAIDELDLIPAGTTSPAPETVAWERAQAIYKHRRRYEEAAQAFGVVVELGGAHAVEAEFYQARSLARAHRDDEAIAAYREFAKQHPRDERATDAGYLAATLELQLNRLDAAIAALEKLVGSTHDGPGRPQSRWMLGFAYLLAARPADALELVDGTVDDDDDAYSRARALYWGAVARADLGRRDEAAEKFLGIIAEFPLHWYALLARQRLGKLGQEVPPPYPERTVGRSDARERCDDLPVEVDALRRAGLVADARSVLLESLPPRIAEAAGDELRQVTGELLCVDAVDEVYRHAAGAHAGDWGLTLDAESLPWWEAAYPKAWREAVEEAATREEMSPYVVWAIMRQESSFDADVVSSADAIGLLQMIPPTTQRMLAARGETYDDAVLFDPRRNIELGVEYIAWIGRKFHGQTALQAAGFNGGPHAVARWLDEQQETRLDFFVERIPFEQTRNYVRRVLTSYARYVFLYETEDDSWPLELPETVRLDYLSEPDY